MNSRKAALPQPQVKKSKQFWKKSWNLFVITLILALSKDFFVWVGIVSKHTVLSDFIILSILKDFSCFLVFLFYSFRKTCNHVKMNRPWRIWVIHDIYSAQFTMKTSKLSFSLLICYEFGHSSVIPFFQTTSQQNHSSPNRDHMYSTQRPGHWDSEAA
jgi:hypothetical protein